MNRRLIDILVSSIALIVFAPVFLLAALLVFLNDGFPVFFLQWRAGLNAVPFRMIKFRTMRRNSERVGGTLTYAADQRITAIGRVLRKYKLDELPQLVNVIRGEMTLIGPRPEVMDWVERYTTEQRRVFEAKPGLTDPVQILFRHEQDYLKHPAQYEKLMAIKVQKQIEYFRARTALSDLKAALATIRVLISSRPSKEELAIYRTLEMASENDVNT